MTYVVDTEVINPYGICLGEGLSRENYTPYVDYSIYYTLLIFQSYQGSFNPLDISNPNSHSWESSWRFSLATGSGDYIRQAHNLSSDTRINVELAQTIFHPQMTSSIDQRTFETKAEALEYVDTLGNPTPIATIHRDEILFTATWRQQVDGIWIDRDTELRYAGDDISLYTINDLVNFFASFFGITPEEIDVNYSLASRSNLDGPVEPPLLDCEPYIKAIIIDVEGSTDPIEINIDFDRDSVIVIDGDPVVPATMLGNGDGSVTIADNGFISMRNDGGTFFLNEYGTVGFYATGDASLTADNRVQLGVGRTTLTVDSDGFTFRDSTGTVSFTADELNTIKDHAIIGPLPL